MKRLALLLFVVALLVYPVISTAQENGSPIVTILNGHLRYLEGELVPAVEAMPEKGFDFAPKDGEFKNVRTFAQQIRHIAADNYNVSAAILREKPPVALGADDFANPPKTKAEIVKVLKDSLTYAHKAIDSINEQNAYQKVQSPYGGSAFTNNVSLMTGILTHNWNHYGQIVVYLRMNGIIPPASRPK